MTYSPLVDRVMPTDKHSSREGREITRVIGHHWAGIGGGIERLVHSDDEASANYIILDSGLLIGSVPEEYRAWTSGSWSADAPSITVEIQNASTGPDWLISADAIATFTRLIADVATRHGWSSVTPARVKGHRDFAATACPGPYLYPRLPGIARDAARLHTEGDTTMPTPRDIWRWRNIDYVNPDDPTSKEHELSKAHLYAFNMWRRIRSADWRAWLAQGIWRRRGIDYVNNTGDNPWRSTHEHQLSRSHQYSLEDLNETRAVRKMLEAMAKAQGEDIERAVLDALAEHDKRVVTVDISVADDAAAGGDDHDPTDDAPEGEK